MVSQCSITLFYRWLTWHLNVNPFWSNSVIKYISLPTDSMLDNTVACKSNILYLVFFFCCLAETYILDLKSCLIMDFIFLHSDHHLQCISPFTHICKSLDKKGAGPVHLLRLAVNFHFESQ